MSNKYFARLSDSTAKKRKSFWKGLGKYPFTKSEYEKADEVPGDSTETRPSKYNKKYKMMFGEEKKRSVTALKKKAKASGVPYSILKQVYNRGMAAWVTGHRPGATQSAWAFARVNSFLTKGKTWYGADADLAKKARKYLKEAHMFGYTDWGWITPEGISVRPIESDKTHTSILRRLGEQSKYNLSKNETEFSVTKKGWIRWLFFLSELRFNTSKWNGSINVQKTINSIVNKYLNVKEYSFEWLGNSGEYQRIEVEDPGAFMLKLSVERRKGLMTEDQDNELEMISGQLKKIIDLSTDTLNVIQNGSEIPAWIQDKISVSVHNAEAIYDYFHYSESIQEQVDIDSAINKILERAKQKFPKLYPKIEAAYKLANMAHEGQFRKSTGSKYIIHPMEVFNSAMDYGFTDEPTLLAAILHDVMEDGPSSITFESLSKEFGRATAITVKLLSKAFSAEDSPDKVKVDHDTYFTNLKTAPISVKNIKALDRLDNVKDIDEFSPKKLANYVPETQELLKIFGKDVPNVSADIMKRIAPYIEEYGIKEPIQEETQMKKVVIFPGGYHPFHKGHYSVYSAIKKEFPEADVYIASTNTQTERPFSFEDKKYLAGQLGVPEESFVQVKIPYVAKEITNNYDPKNTIVIFALSEKDADRISYTKKDGTPGYFAKWTGSDVQPFETKGYIYITPKIDFKVAGKQVDSASMIRKMYKEADDVMKKRIIKDMYPGGDVETIQAILDNNLSESIQESVEIISETIRCSKKTGKNICFVFSKKGKKLGGPYSETKAKKRLRQIEFFKHLNK